MIYKLNYYVFERPTRIPVIGDEVIYIDKDDPEWNSTGEIINLSVNVATVNWLTGRNAGFGSTREDIDNLSLYVHACPMEAL